MEEKTVQELLEGRCLKSVRHTRYGKNHVFEFETDEGILRLDIDFLFEYNWLSSDTKSARIKLKL